jgi:hypothetical protein
MVSYLAFAPLFPCYPQYKRCHHGVVGFVQICVWKGQKCKQGQTGYSSNRVLSAALSVERFQHKSGTIFAVAQPIQKIGQFAL